MIKLYGREYTKAELLRRVGDISQLGSVKHYELKTGNSKGVEAVDFRTGSGFNFTVLPGRGMDISFAEYNGIPLCWRSSTGDIAASYYEPGSGWLRGFYGGLLVTCGMTYVGAPGPLDTPAHALSRFLEEGEELGLHGRVSYIPAQNVWVDSRWEGNEYIMWVQGKVREATVFGQNLCLTRRIQAKLGDTKLRIEDVIENLGYEPVPFMYLYHVNGGFPAVDDGSEVISTAVEVLPRDEIAETGIGNYSRFQGPMPNFKEEVFYHDMECDEENHVYAALVNKEFNNGQGFGFYIRYHKTQFPRFIQWKMTGEGIYVAGMEPANCWVEGRAKEQERGTLQYIEPGGRKHYESEIGVLRSREEIEELEGKIANIKSI